MIALSVYLTPKTGKAEELESAIRDRWVKAMSEQPGFLRAATLEPFPDDELAKLEAVKPDSAYEVVSFWRSEEERAAWVARPIHDEVFRFVMDAAESLTYTLQTVEQDWSM